MVSLSDESKHTEHTAAAAAWEPAWREQPLDRAEKKTPISLFPLSPCQDLSRSVAAAALECSFRRAHCGDQAGGMGGRVGVG